VTPEAERFLQNADDHLERGRIMIADALNDDAGRAAFFPKPTTSKLSPTTTPDLSPRFHLKRPSMRSKQPGHSLLTVRDVLTPQPPN